MVSTSHVGDPIPTVHGPFEVASWMTTTTPSAVRYVQFERFGAGLETRPKAFDRVLGRGRLLPCPMTGGLEVEQQIHGQACDPGWWSLRHHPAG
jgi:hypothetical protein